MDPDSSFWELKPIHRRLSLFAVPTRARPRVALTALTWTRVVKLKLLTDLGEWAALPAHTGLPLKLR